MLKQNGELEKAFQTAKQAAYADDQNREILTLHMQLAQERNAKAGNRLGETGRQQKKSKAQLTAKDDLKQATSMLLNQMERPCNRVLAMEQGPEPGDIATTCSPDQRGTSTVRYILNAAKGSAWEE